MLRDLLMLVMAGVVVLLCFAVGLHHPEGMLSAGESALVCDTEDR